MIRALIIAALLGLSAAATSPAALAYTWGETDDGTPTRWQIENVGYFTSVIPPESFTDSDAREAIALGFAPWSRVSCAMPNVRRIGDSLAAARTPPRTLVTPSNNVVVFVRTPEVWLDSGHSRLWIALTSIGHNSLTGEIVDADIEINDAFFDFSLEEPGDGEIDFVSVMTHEAGHFLGLDHSDVVSATMYDSYTTLENALEARTLDADDIEGICALYGLDDTELPPQTLDRCGSAASGAPTSPLLWLFALIISRCVFVGRARRRTPPRLI